MMRFALSRALVLAFAFVACMPALAEEPYKAIEQRMPAEEFKAAGLDKLSPEELARLNAWLSAEQGVQVEAVRAQVRADVEQAQEKRAGFFERENREPVNSALKGEFRGWSGRMIFDLANGQSWEMVEPSSLYVPRALRDPKVKITPGLISGWYLQVEGYNTRAKVRRVK